MSLLFRQTRPFHVALLAMVLLASIFGRPDVPIDETRYLGVAWEMWSGGSWLDFLVPHRNGVAYHHKPPLLFWLINAGWVAFGINGWWPRVVTALFALACLPLTAALAARLWHHEGAVGERAGWFLLGGAFWLFFSTSVIFDVMLTAFVLLALYAAVRAADGERFATWGLFGLAIGLVVLSKGPVILLHVLPVLLLAPWWVNRPLVWKDWYRGLLIGVLVGAAIALAWAVPAAYFGGEEYRNAIFWGQTAGRVSGSLAHRQPPWFYLAILPLLLFPWFLWAGAWRALAAALREHGEARAGIRFCLLWITLTLIGFSLTGGKQAHYILPLLPAFALLMALGLPKIRPSGRWGAMALTLALAWSGGALLLRDFWLHHVPWLIPYAGLEWSVGGVALVFLAFVNYLVVRGDDAMPRLAVISALFVAICLLTLLRPLAPTFDMTPMAQRLKGLEAAGVPVAHASAYNDQYHFYGRLTRPLQEISRGEIKDWLEKHPQGRVVTYVKKPGDVEALRPEYSQPYLDGAVVLVDARSVARLPAK